MTEVYQETLDTDTMSEPYNEKMSAPEVTTGTSTPPHDEEKQAPEVSHQPLGKPWMYKRFGFGRAKMSYASPQFQVIFVAMVCFLCPGMYNAVSGLGAAGFVTAHDIDNASTALNSTFAAVGFFCGSIANRIGLRLTLGIGGFGYFIYTASLLSYKHNQNAGFLIFAGALLGCCAAMLWTAQGAVMMAYPPEHKKGRYISWFWMIFNTGGVLGALIPLGQNVNNSSGSGVNDGTYIAFMVLMFAGFVLAAFLCNPKFVVREDGSRVILMKHPSWKSEILGLFETFRTDWYILFLFPMFLSSNWFYTYHFQDVNLPNFNTRTRTLNNVLYWSMQIVGAYVTGYMLDTKFSRKTKAKVDIIYLFLLTMAIWGGGYAYQRTYNRESTDPKTGFVGKDWTDSGYIGPLFLYMFYGFFDAAWQTSVYW